MNDSEESLVKESQKLNRSAFEELVRRTARLVFARLYLDVADTHRAEDLTQETFLRAWRSIHQVTDAAGFRTWLLAIARTVAMDAMRSDGRQKRAGSAINSEQTFPKLADAGPGPLQAADNKEQHARLLSAIRSLPQEYRDPLTLRYIAGADYETIGQQLGLTNGSLRGLLHRGMTRLRVELKREGIEP